MIETGFVYAPYIKLKMPSPMLNYKVITACRACGNPHLKQFLHLGFQPLANAYRKKKEESPVAPLEVNVCKSCFHSQLSVVIEPNVMFKDYAYLSGTTKTLDDYFEWFSQYTLTFLRAVNKGKQDFTVLDIACNDGSQLAWFRKEGAKTIGVDPAENLKDQAEQNCDLFLNEYWNAISAQKVAQYTNQSGVDAIIAQNVFGHVDDIYDFLKQCKKVMHQNTLIFIQTSQANWVNSGQYDYWYFEHLSNFTTKSMQAICKRVGLTLNMVQKTNVHGTSYCFVIGGRQLIPSNIHDTIKKEKKQGLYSLPTYISFGKKAWFNITGLKGYVESQQAMDRKVIAFGATAKFMTVVNAGNIQVDYIVDENPLKQGKFTPGQDIPIVPITAISREQEPNNLVIIAGAWNYYPEIKKKILAFRGPGDILVKYFPKPTEELLHEEPVEV